MRFFAGPRPPKRVTFVAAWRSLLAVATKAPRRAATPRPKRQRRSAEEAHEQILDAAERRLDEAGPRGIRLQEIAADVGVSHPTILHHFGSREGLVKAVVQRALAGLHEKIVAVLTERTPNAGEGAELVRQVSATLGDRGYARLMAWLALEGQPAGEPPRLLHVLGQTMHARRVAETGSQAPLEDTLHLVLLAALALFGEGVLGDAMFESAGLGDDPSAHTRFHEWLARLIEQHLHGPGLVDAAEPAAAPAAPSKVGRRRARSKP